MALDLVEQFQHAETGAVHHRHRHLSGFNRRQQGLFIAAGFGHRQIVTRHQRCGTIFNTVPVGHHQPFISPLIAQNLSEQKRILGGLHAVKTIVGRHHRPRPGFRNRALETRQIDFPQRPFFNNRIHFRAAVLRVVRRKVFQAGANPLLLQAVDQRSGNIAADHRIFGVIFIASPGQRRTANVNPRPEQDPDAHLLTLPPQRFPHLMHQLHVPAAGQAGTIRKAGRR